AWVHKLSNSLLLLLYRVVLKEPHPNDFAGLEALEHQLLAFQNHYEKIAKPIKWKFTKKDLNRILLKLSSDTGLLEKMAA
ncbi:MAG: hypothetical protein P1P89_21520, partial [Desulfobacterales bacterium]|nr:hypothetical protein [Desulfobacterales bacterium]